MHEPGVAPVGPERPVNDPLQDQRALQILSTEHWSLLATRSLSYNEGLTRASMFLALLSMSFVGLAFLAQGIGFTADFLLVAALVVAFDLLIGTFTVLRIASTNMEDVRAIHAMNRIRHAYVEIAPEVRPYFVTGIHDDPAGVQKTYGWDQPESTRSNLLFGLSTSLGMVGLIVAVLAGLLASLVALLARAPTWLAVGVACVTAVLVLVVELTWGLATVRRTWAGLEVRFPTPEE